MKNPFSVDSAPRPNLPRNAVPLSYQNLFTTEFGRITPVFCKEVLPDDTFQIDGSIAIQGMPTVFPVQTRIRASLSFFYSRNRNVFDEFEDFIFKTKDVEAPWLKLTPERAKKMIATNTLGDFFNIATTHAEDSDVHVSVLLSSLRCLGIGRVTVVSSSSTLGDIRTIFAQSYTARTPIDINGYNASYVANYPSIGYVSDPINSPFPRELFSVPFLSDGSPVRVEKCFLMLLNSENVCIYLPIECFPDAESYESGLIHVKYIISDSDYDSVSSFVSSLDEPYKIVIGTYFVRQDSTLQQYSPYFPLSPTINDFVPSSLDIIVSQAGILDATDDSVIANNPYVGDNPKDRLDVWKFRHYEMICNYYYRDDRNNPYYLNGEPQYNEFIPTHAGGPDENVYDFHYSPWEKDPFTTAVQSPQFGDAPLVGITINSDGSSADLVFNKDGGTAVDGSTTENYPKIRVHIDDEGYIDGIGDFSDDVPSASLRKLINGIQSKQGISINDFRVTNSFQRFLENTLRRGLRYRNQLKSHFGVSVDYPDIDVPEYIGGVSTELNVSRVTNTADSPNAGLGDFVGQLSGLLQMKHKITRYIHEHGFIMGLLTLTPIPTYSQVTSKDNLKIHPFDFYQTEFGKIGYVPIHYNEVAPLQIAPGESIDDVFGYQKAWYDYMFAFDEVHGDFRTTLKDFVLSRTFADRPILVEDFVRVKPDQLNHIFVTENIADAYGSSAKFLCNAFFTVSAKRPIPVRGIPSLE